jgi:hypothetical protein
LLYTARAVEFGKEITTQKTAIVDRRRRTVANKNRARRLEIPTVMVSDDEQSHRALELLGDMPKKENAARSLMNLNRLKTSQAKTISHEHPPQKRH